MREQNDPAACFHGERQLEMQSSLVADGRGIVRTVRSSCKSFEELLPQRLEAVPPGCFKLHLSWVRISSTPARKKLARSDM